MVRRCSPRSGSNMYMSPAPRTTPPMSNTIFVHTFFSSPPCFLPVSRWDKGLERNLVPGTIPVYERNAYILAAQSRFDTSYIIETRPSLVPNITIRLDKFCPSSTLSDAAMRRSRTSAGYEATPYRTRSHTQEEYRHKMAWSLLDCVDI